ncbi:MAG: tetratricopeptide repeat protein [Treponema sp.]|nr:tetratricopeptide repeat protein [Treponema sp.]
MKNRNKMTAFLLAVLIFSPLTANAQTVFKSSKASNESARSFYDKGIDAENAEEWANATQHYMEAVRINPAYADAWYHLARVSYFLGEPDLALQYLVSAEKIEKTNSRILNLKGLIYLSLGQTKEAYDIFTQILEVYPNDVSAHFGLAELQLADGRFSGAKKEYEEALKRQGDNKKALLSLALLCAYTNDFTNAQNYLRRALNYYSSDPTVHYLSAIMSCMKGDLQNAENQARISVELNRNYTEGYRLLSQILFYEEKYEETIDLCDYQISKDRSEPLNWYLKGLAQKRMGNPEAAVVSWSKGLDISPQDEIMRMTMELEVRDTLSLEDVRRKNWASYHVNIADQCSERYDGTGASYEYQRALRIDPMNRKARIAYANMLELNGMHELYLEQLKFVEENSNSGSKPESKLDDIKLSDTIEAYNSLLSETLAKKWNIQSFYLDKIRWKIAVFYEDRPMNFVHAEADRLTAMAASDIFAGIAQTSVKTQGSPVSGYGEAFRLARTQGFDYFVILSLEEGRDDMTLNATMYSARTGTETEKMAFYATGNNRFSTVLRRFRTSVLENLPVRGKIIKRKAKSVLVDLGKSEHIINGAQFQIVRKGKISTADTGTGLSYREDDILGTIEITDCGEEVSEGLISINGFYDKINDDDEVVLISLPELNTDAAIDTAPVADARGNVVVNQKPDTGTPLNTEIRKAVSHPAILELIQNIY